MSERFEARLTETVRDKKQGLLYLTVSQGGDANNDLDSISKGRV